MNSTEKNGPVMALDLGRRRVGVAVSDKLQITIKRLAPIQRSNWKSLLLHVRGLVEEFDAQTLVIGLPLRLDGTEGDAAIEARTTAIKFAKSLSVPVYVQDERLTSNAAESDLRESGHRSEEITQLIDSESAAIILRDFLVTGVSDKMLIATD